MYYTYALLSLRDKKFYIGYTQNLRRRIQEHERGKTRSTCRRRPLVLVYYEAHSSKYDALRRERYYKTRKGRSSLRQVVREGVKRFL